jgi:tRNA(Ile)-lysidine synthase
LGAKADFPATEALRALALKGRAGQKLALTSWLAAERTPRELRLAVGGRDASVAVPEYSVAIPGEVAATAFGLRLRIEVIAPAEVTEGQTATVRNWRPGDRVRLRHSSGQRKVKEILERLRVTGSRRALWPVVELNGQIAWMRGVELGPTPGIAFVECGLDGDGG